MSETIDTDEIRRIARVTAQYIHPDYADQLTAIANQVDSLKLKSANNEIELVIIKALAHKLFYLAGGLHDDDSYYGNNRGAPAILLEAAKILGDIREGYLGDIGIEVPKGSE